MSNDKIQPALRDEMARLRSSGARDARVPVIVSIAGIDSGRLRDVASLEAEVRRVQAPAAARLADLGVRDFAPLTLANAIEATLTIDQIEAMASEASVVAIVWNRLERVTAQ